MPIYNFIIEEGSEELDPLDDTLNALVDVEENMMVSHDKNMRHLAVSWIDGMVLVKSQGKTFPGSQ